MPFTILTLSRRRQDIAFEEYKHYYETNHAPLVSRLLGPDAPETYVRHYIDRADTSAFVVGKPQAIEHDCCAVVTWRDKAAYEQGMARFSSPDVQTLVAEDEEKFLDRPALTVVVVGDSPCTFKTE